MLVRRQPRRRRRRRRRKTEVTVFWCKADEVVCRRYALAKMEYVKLIKRDAMMARLGQQASKILCLRLGDWARSR